MTGVCIVASGRMAHAHSRGDGYEEPRAGSCTPGGFHRGFAPRYASTTSLLCVSLTRPVTPHPTRPADRCYAGGAFKQMRVLLKYKLVHHENAKYDGYRLTPLVRRCPPTGQVSRTERPYVLPSHRARALRSRGRQTRHLGVPGVALRNNGGGGFSRQLRQYVTPPSCLRARLSHSRRATTSWPSTRWCPGARSRAWAARLASARRATCMRHVRGADVTSRRRREKDDALTRARACASLLCFWAHT